MYTFLYFLSQQFVDVTAILIVLPFPHPSGDTIAFHTALTLGECSELECVLHTPGSSWRPCVFRYQLAVLCFSFKNSVQQLLSSSLVVMNSSGFSLPGKVFISFSFLKDNVAVDSSWLTVLLFQCFECVILFFPGLQGFCREVHRKLSWSSIYL